MIIIHTNQTKTRGLKARTDEKNDYRIWFDLIGLVWWCFSATFNNISVISWQSVLLVEETRVSGETTDLSQVTD